MTPSHDGPRPGATGAGGPRPAGPRSGPFRSGPFRSGSFRAGSPRPSGPGAPRRPDGPGPRLLRCVQDGRVSPAPPGTTFAGLLDYARSEPDRMGLAVLLHPRPADIQELARAWDLHPLLVEDLEEAGQRPKIERHGDVLFLVARSARYLDAAEEVQLTELHLLIKDRAVALLCQDGRLLDGTAVGSVPGREVPGPEATGPEAGADPAPADGGEAMGIDGRWLIGDQDLLRLGPEAIAYRLLDVIVDGYGPVLAGLENDKDEIERQVFSGDAAAAARIYRLSQEVIDLLHTTSALQRAVQGLRQGFEKHGVPIELQRYLGDVADHLAHAVESAGSLRDALAQILDVNATLVAQRQNEDMKKISGWAAILFAPTLIAAIYGMNFDLMPELHWRFGYPLAVGAMILFAVALYIVFRIKKWM